MFAAFTDLHSVRRRGRLSRHVGHLLLLQGCSLIAGHLWRERQAVRDVHPDAYIRKTAEKIESAGRKHRAELLETLPNDHQPLLKQSLSAWLSCSIDVGSTAGSDRVGLQLTCSHAAHRREPRITVTNTFVAGACLWVSRMAFITNVRGTC